MQRRQRPGWHWVLASIVALAALAGIILAVWKLPSLLYGDVTKASADARLQAASGFRTALVAGLAGLAALGSLVMATRTFRLTQEGQITERYTKAIEQLGSDKLDVRLGGIYALERIAKDSVRDHPTVVEVLSAFVREHSDPAPTDSSKPAASERLSAVLEGEEPTDGPRPHVEDTDNKATPLRPASDVQAAVTVLGRLPSRPYVSRGDLTGAILAGVELILADLSGIRLSRADLSDGKLMGLNLPGALLDQANLVGARLTEANLSRTRLLGANLSRARLPQADLSHAGLQHANLSGAVLMGANLSGALLGGADLSGAMLTGATLAGAELRGANLSGAMLGGGGYSVHPAPSGGSSLRPLPDVVGLTQEQLDSTHGDAQTRLPEGLRRPEGWTADQNSSTANSFSQRPQKRP
jgi:hypothetical protein